MNAPMHINEEAAYRAVTSRDARYDGQFYFAVITTGVYCRPSCPARRPKQQNVRFYRTGDEARKAGFRACLRCRPDEAGEPPEWLTNALDRLRTSDSPVALTELCRESGLGPDQFRRRFRAAVGLTPAAFFRSVRAERMKDTLDRSGRVTDAVYDAGFNAPSHFYTEANRRLGMAPSAWRDGGAGVEITWTLTKTSLGDLLVATTDRGVCRVAFDETGAELADRFPRAKLRRARRPTAELAQRVAAIVERIDGDPAEPSLPLDVRGTAFQEQVWRALTRIPPGETRSYRAIAASIDKPQAVRAVGTACGKNPVAVAIPCHRAVRSDGGLGGYAWGLDRKRALLEAETKRGRTPGAR